MRHPASHLAVALLAATIATAAPRARTARAEGSGTARATAPRPSPARADAHRKSPPAAPPRADARRGQADDDAYRCHPGEDIVCTIVRETAQGVVIATRRGADSDQPGIWSVVSGAPAGVPVPAGGIVYVVPTGAADASAATRPNGAPILD